jgi:predicted Zn-dependent protease
VVPLGEDDALLRHAEDLGADRGTHLGAVAAGQQAAADDGRDDVEELVAAALAGRVGLLEWYRKSELSSDRAGLLGVQDPQVVYRAMLKMAGGGKTDEMSVTAFLEQAEAYRESEDVADAVFKVLNLMATTHPFYVLRVSELRSWVESGAYDRILGGDYVQRGEPEREYAEDLSEAASAYQRDAREFVDDLTAAARRMRDAIFENLRGGGGAGAGW